MLSLNDFILNKVLLSGLLSRKILENTFKEITLQIPSIETDTRLLAFLGDRNGRN